MSKALPPLNTSQGAHNNSYTAGTSGAYAGQNTGRSYSSTSRTMGPMRTVPKLPQIDFTLGPLQERTLPSYNDLEDPHLYPYWRRQESLVYARQARREEQIRRERQEARQQEASRRRFQERRRREREELAAKKGVRSDAADEPHSARQPPRKSKPAGSARSSRRASERRQSAELYPTEADQFGEPAAADEPSTTDSDADEDARAAREEEALWAHIEGFMAPEPAGVPLRALPLMAHADFVTMAKEHRQLSDLDVAPKTRLADLERAMDEYATGLAQEENWRSREAFLGSTVEGVPLRALPLDDNAEFVQLEKTRRDLCGQSSPSRRQRIATVEGRMQEITHELAAAHQHGAYPTEDSDKDGKATESEDDESAADAATPIHAVEIDKWSDREEYLGAYPEGVALRDIPLDDNEAFTTLEAERHHLLREGGRQEHGAAIGKMEDRLRVLCEESARAVKDKESAAKDRYEDDDFEDDDKSASDKDDDDDKDKWAELGDDDDEKKSTTPAASSKRSSVNADDKKWDELGDDDDDEKAKSASVPRLTAEEETYPVESNATRDVPDWAELGDDEDEKDKKSATPAASSKRSSVNADDKKWDELGDDDDDEKAKSASVPRLTAAEETYPVEPNATRDVPDWAELGDDEDDDKKKKDTEALPHLFAGEEEGAVDKDDYDDDDFEAEDDDDEDKKSSVVSSKRSSVNADDSKWDELGDDEDEKEKKSATPAASSKRSSVNADDSKWDELGDDEDEKPRGVVAENKSASAVSSKKSSVVESSKPSTLPSSRRSSSNASSAASDVKAPIKDQWAELGDDEDDDAAKKSESSDVEEEVAKKSSRVSTPASSKPKDAYDDDDDWDEM